MCFTAFSASDLSTGWVTSPSNVTAVSYTHLDVYKRQLQGIRPQLGQFLDLDGDRALLLNNADWLSTLSTLEYLRCLLYTSRCV